MNEYDFIKKDFPRYSMDPMSDDKDLVAELILINKLNPKVCWEIGTGKADWALFVNQYMNIRSEWNLTENFDWINVDNLEIAKYIPDDWPKNLNDIDTHIKQVCKKQKTDFNYKLYSQDIRDITIQNGNLVDLWRIDCDLPNPENAVEYMLAHSSNNVIFFVDDIPPNHCINRLIMMMDQVRKGNLELVWVGKNEAAWTRPNILDLPNIYYLFEESKHYFKRFMLIDDKPFYGRNTEYFVSE